MTSKIISQDSPVPTDSPGRADIVGFGKSGVAIRRINMPPTVVIANFGFDAGGWRVERHVRLVADITGDKHGDIVGFGENGVWIAINNGNNTFQTPKLVISNFAIGAGGWTTDKHIRFMADIRNVGRADVVGFGEGGVWVSPNNGGGNFGNVTMGLADFGYSQGWRLDKHLRFLADVTGGGRPDIVGFGENQVWVGRNNGNGTFQPATGVVQDFCYSAGGWRIEKHPRFLADLTGDGRADIIGFGDAGVLVSINNGNGTFQAVKLVIADFAYVAGGWRVEKHPRLIADLTGDKKGDIVGFGDAGVFVALNNGDGTFQPPRLVINDFGYVAGGWRVEKHLRFAVDLTGDGRADIIGFGEGAVWVSYNAGDGNFGPVQQLTTSFGFNGGEWALNQTVRYMANL